VERKTFNVAYSSSGESEVTPQLKEKIHTTEKKGENVQILIALSNSW
jgi:hypothetical protein